jgi:hypothetical protein
MLSQLCISINRSAPGLFSVALGIEVRTDQQLH